MKSGKCFFTDLFLLTIAFSSCLWADLCPALLERYNATVQSVSSSRHSFVRSLLHARNSSCRDSVYDRMRLYIRDEVVDSLAPYWYGTPWDYYGASQVPGSGYIACGYFVSTILQHAGFNVERVRLAQQASEWVVRTLTTSRYIRQFCDVPLRDFCDSVGRMGEGLYVVGLDYHVGLLAVKDGEVYFIHSTNMPPACAKIEVASQSNVLDWTSCRIVGRITADDELLRKWATGQAIATKTLPRQGRRP
jgi:hypothetical protein